MLHTVVEYILLAMRWPKAGWFRIAHNVIPNQRLIFSWQASEDAL